MRARMSPVKSSQSLPASPAGLRAEVADVEGASPAAPTAVSDSLAARSVGESVHASGSVVFDSQPILSSSGLPQVPSLPSSFAPGHFAEGPPLIESSRPFSVSSPASSIKGTALALAHSIESKLADSSPLFFVDRASSNPIGNQCSSTVSDVDDSVMDGKASISMLVPQVPEGYVMPSANLIQGSRSRPPPGVTASWPASIDVTLDAIAKLLDDRISLCKFHIMLWHLSLAICK